MAYCPFLEEYSSLISHSRSRQCGANTSLFEILVETARKVSGLLPSASPPRSGSALPAHQSACELPGDSTQVNLMVLTVLEAGGLPCRQPQGWVLGVGCFLGCRRRTFLCISQAREAEKLSGVPVMRAVISSPLFRPPHPLDVSPTVPPLGVTIFVRGFEGYPSPRGPS